MLDQSYIDKVDHRVQELERELAQPDAASNQQRYRSLIGEHQRLTDILARGRRYLHLLEEQQDSRQLIEDPSTDAEMKALARADLERIEADLPGVEREAMIALLPPDPDDSRNTIVEIRAGTGGEEAALFAADLCRMYTRYAEIRGWKVGVIDASFASMGGYKEVILLVEGDEVYRTLRYESGGHRVQRIPVTEAGGRIHTSAATVAVLPEAEEVDEVTIDQDDLRIDLYRASGPGGQKVNKTESAVRITHLPTGIVVQSQDERSQHINREKAMRVLKAKLLDRARAEDAAQQASERKSQVGSGDRSERIRTYNFPQNRVTDHRINLTLYNLNEVIEGNLDPLVEAIQDVDIQNRLNKLFQGAGA